MAYIFNSNEKYYVLKDFAENLVDLHLQKNVFEVDELLAYPVALLCNKGYVTEMSCAGHAYGSVYYKDEKDFDVIKDVELMREYVKDYETTYVVCHGLPEPGTFIRFVKDFTLAELPAGWIYKDNLLKYEMPMKKDASTYYKELTEIILELTKWIEKLPSIKR